MQGITITYNGLTLGDDTNFYISALDIGDLPIRQADQLASGRDGGFIFNQNYGMRTISFNVNIFSGTDAQLFEDISSVRVAFARTNTAKELTINYWDGTTKKIDVFPSILPNPTHLPGNTDKSSFSVFLTAPFPFFKGSSTETATLELNESEGFDYPMDYPFDYEAGASTNTYIFNNDGDVPALVKVTFNGPVISPTLTNTSTGNSVQIDTTLSGGTSVVLEYTSTGRSIRDQNGVSYEQYFNGETAFFFIPIGSNTFVFSASTFDSQASCDLVFNKYYLS